MVNPKNGQTSIFGLNDKSTKWSNIQFWVDDKSTKWPNIRFWVDDKFTKWPNIRFWVDDKSTNGRSLPLTCFAILEF
jgi:hypothetical protein